MDHLQNPMPFSVEPTIVTAKIGDIESSVNTNGTIDNLSVCSVTAISCSGVSALCDAGSVKPYAGNDAKAQKLSMLPAVDWVCTIRGVPIPARL
ncbi:hypothetical protein [Paraburkholderia phenoliruptrix]|uniref:hypothetical protein n=1 Tax=Paraburkholderia phenoliruptrix TaxID=252970 RepID=UPI003D96D5E5